MTFFSSARTRWLSAILLPMAVLCHAPIAYSAIVPSGSVTATYNGTDNPWDWGDYLTIGNNYNGSLWVDGGYAVVGNQTALGNLSYVGGALTVSGNGSTFTANEDLYIGAAGYADVAVTGGGALSGYRTYLGRYLGSRGSVVVSGDGSTLTTTGEFIIGYDGSGSLKVENGADVTSVNSTVYLGRDAEGAGAAQVTGSGSTWDVRSLYIGREGYGTLSILNGASVTNTYGDVAIEAGSEGAVFVSGEGSRWTQLGTLRLGEEGVGSLTIRDYATVSTSLTHLGRWRDGVGLVEVGPNASWTNADLLVIGDEGFGQLSIRDNSSVITGGDTYLGREDGAYGSLQLSNGLLITRGLLAGADNLQGTGDIHASGLVTDIDLAFDQNHGYQQELQLNSAPGQDVTIRLNASAAPGQAPMGAGFRGTGTLTIADGRAVSSSFGSLGYHAGAHGTAAIDGPGSLWTTAERIYVGNYGSGELVTRNGGRVEAMGINLGRWEGSSGTATVTGEGSSWQVSDFLFVGEYGLGALLIENGGKVSSNYRVIIGVHETSGDASATVTGPGSVWSHVGEFNLGWNNNGETGTLNIRDGALVEIGGYIAMRSPGSTINLEGGTLRLYDSGYVSPFSSTHACSIGGGTLNFTGGRLEGVKLINLAHPFIQQGGVFAPGGPVGNTNIGGDFTLAAGVLEIDMGGPDNTYDSLWTRDNVTILSEGMTLDLKPLGPIPAGSYTIISSQKETVTGTFGSITGLGQYPGLIDIQYLSNAVVVVLTRDFIPGDLDGDGFVGIADLNIVLGAWNQNVTAGDPLMGDPSGNGYVGIEDLNQILSQWSAGAPPISSMHIPEPASSVVLGLSGLTLMRRHSRNGC